jgi:hypothetical protein
MQELKAFIDAVKMYLLIGLVIAIAHALALPPAHGDTLLERSVAVLGDVVGWPKFIVIAAHTLASYVVSAVA